MACQKVANPAKFHAAFITLLLVLLSFTAIAQFRIIPQPLNIIYDLFIS